MKEIFVWVTQTRDDGTAAAHISGTNDPNAFTDTPQECSWTTEHVQNPRQHGTFHPGPAIGSALGVAEKPGDGGITISWWVDSLEIKAPSTGGE